MNFINKICTLVYIKEECDLIKDMKYEFYKEKKFNKSLYDKCKNICDENNDIDKLKHARAILEQQNVFSQCNTNEGSNLLTIITIVISVIASLVAILIGVYSKIPESDVGAAGILVKIYNYILPFMVLFLILAFIVFFMSMFSTTDRRMRAYFYSIVCDAIERKEDSVKPYIKVEITKKKEVELNAETNSFDV